jgi:serine/threonine protein kinase/tetratricopeptide (TPR) repeat protein
MTAARPDNEAIFHAARAIPDPEWRREYVREACGPDEARIAQVEALLAAAEGPDSLLDHPAAGTPGATIELLTTERPGTMIGPYKLVEPIGEGGMGTVWMAQQTAPVKRLVAVKLIKAGMDSKHVIARFEAERQALALMDHPNIARVLDGGTTGGGRPYFVMDLVKGVPITRYCDEHHLTPRQRLELFLPVCQAVQHAHQKGVIHRDLKPSNVLVALSDGQPVPKVIDFGVAKAAGQTLTEKTLVTGFGSIVGTLEYMSPEQAELNNLDIDTRCDVYSLGVLLYELLAGSPPFTCKEHEQGGVLEMLRVIREQEPTKPSAKLSTAEALPTLAANRGTEPAKLTRLVRGELDWIVMKALEKDRRRRYETANGFAMDVQRHLADEPVSACPPSTAYRLRKFVRRNKGPVLAIALVLLALVSGIAGTTIGLLRARASAEAERLARGDAQAKQALAERSAAAERKARRAEAGERWKAREAEADTRAFADFLSNHVLAATRPKGWQLGVGANVTLAEALAKAGPRIRAVFAGRPKAEALARHQIGVTWRNLGRFDEAGRHLRRALELRREALGPDHPDTLETMNSLGVTYQQDGQFRRAVPLLEQALAKRKKKLGRDHPNTLTGMNNLASAYRDAGRLDRALPLYEQALARLQGTLGPNHPDTLTGLHNLASAYHAAGRLDRALPLLEQSLATHRKTLGPDHLDTLVSMNELAVAHQEAGRPDRAVPLFEQALTKMKEKLPADHPNTLATMNNLASAHLSAGRPDRALPLCEQALARMTETLGPDHAYTLNCLNNLASAHLDAGRPARAVPLFEQALARMKEKLPADHPDTLNCLHNLAQAHHKAGQPRKAVPLFEQALAKMKEKLGADHPQTLSCGDNLAVVYWSMRKLDQSIPLLEQTLRLREQNRGANPHDAFRTAFNLVVNYRDAGRLDEAVALCDRWLPRVRTTLKPGQPARNYALAVAADAYGRAGRQDRIEPLLRELADRVKQQAGADSPAYAGQLAQLGMNLLLQHKHAAAEPVLRKCLALREKGQPGAWTTFNTQSMLGDALLGQEKYAEAEPLLLRGYEGMRQCQDQIPKGGKARLTEALERLVQLYDAWGKQEKAAEWRKQLEAHEQAEKRAQQQEK